ncbi:acetyl-CoA carboxylase carboxyltransferase subunit alpha [Campylobacter hominis]|uniref:Acetyl-coenzyme A carboxylase carboxyl transferase subunit alpha n=1 Tax=Campylobacter hominis (strain ATCC BAA-381 / DSM 21671 / CCUG 45161 / LMG 19568 / NCTC 13146 / CH001A) TaxID=360107 RepID=ACCA_CAMHC|nr:acetyl-CoA carboxylase carboxyltransferase subunit alpha [Campylobacter hominis]A7HZZ3.1 RecName: Full=Acetyl-coenzyme A carboxylase carboxyl transferase subunit alpha; Short=ACCase subunit alpha; Short=Acetyl-CoA carboxylase carboxyltransferase subunit alpha [Campylobacter hominis ATCC BAA-381]ABS51332.1 acetyl-CoA carboxylase, carboxyl transferase, alpha subunit [Campylobacter hominis ATCC BAA-381]UAK85309.1 acetyl-CoA carboxylase carboxyltransferase subunit alpha [Campylobacter hominis]SU
MANYLDFEKSIKQIDDDISSAKIRGDDSAVEILKKNLEKEINKVYKNLSEFQRLQLARHPDRPYSLDYVRALLKNYYEIHGDRVFRDDPSIVCFLGYIADKKIVVIAEQKGRGTKYKLKRNFGMPHPEGYRKALRVAKLAEKFSIPIIFFIDTPGAYPGIGAEERGQSEAIARNLFEFSDIKTPTIAIVIGEGGSGGALAIGVADKLAMLSNSIFSVISPEGCAAILWKDPDKSEAATKALKITAEELKELNLIDDVIKEPKMGAHRDKDAAAKAVGNYIIEKLNELEKIPLDEILRKRKEKILNTGVFEEL